MYTKVWLTFGKKYGEECKAEFYEEEIDGLELNEKELGKVFQPYHYGEYHPFGIYVSTVKSSNEKAKKKAKEKLLKEAMEVVKARIDIDTEVYDLLQKTKEREVK